MPAAASRMKDFALPDLGEGLTEGEILQWMVKVGDTVTLNQPIVEVETAKAAVEVPSPYAGVVTALHHEAGSTVDVGSVIITFDTDPSAGPVPPTAAGSLDEVTEGASTPTPDSPAAQEGALIGEVGPTGRTATLVGYGPKSVTAKRRPRSAAGDAQAASAPPVAAPPPPPATAARVSAAAVGQSAAHSAGAVTVLAKPPVRKLAKDLGVDLATVVASGPHGSITRADVEAAAGAAPPTTGAPAAVTAVPAYDPETRERRIPVKGVRKLTAQAMVSSAFSAPHVTEFVTVDVTPTMDLVQRLRSAPEMAGLKVTPLLLVAKALLLAVRRNPEVNATFTEDEIVVKDYVHLGIAAATPRGLIVPNIKDADRMDLPALARALQELTETARAGKTQPADMQHGTITITNVGVFGVDNGTPILNPGESAILCFGAVRPMPWVHEGEIAVRQVTQLALSFDHRNVDGQLGSQFLADIARVLADPSVALLWS